MLGCTIPWAENYNPSATEDDGSCIYLESIDGVCYEFTDVPRDQQLDQSFTLSYALERKAWSFYHDYWPDMYLHTRSKFMNLKTNQAYYHNEGLRGVYHNQGITQPFFIDLLFATNSALKLPSQARYTQVFEPYPKMVLDNINWVSEVRNTGNDPEMDDQPALYNETITAITIWNNYQCTGRIPLDGSVLSLTEANNRNSEQKWNFNSFRDILTDQGTQFLKDIFHDYGVDQAMVDINKPWFNKRLMEGTYFIVRFEFDNNNDKQITLHDLDVDVSKSYR